MIVIKNLAFHNFMRYPELELSLDSLGLVLLKGINLDEPKKGSSGAGKTMFIDGIHWLFSGRTGRGITSDKIIGEADVWTSVSADLEINGRPVHVSRFRRHPQYENSFVVMDGRDATRHTLDQTEDRFYEILGCSFKLMRVSCFYDSDPQFHFSRMSAGTRGELFDNIVGTEQAKIQERYREVNSLLRDIQDRLLSAKNLAQATTVKIEAENNFLKESADMGRQVLESYKARIMSLKNQKTEVPDLPALQRKCQEFETTVAAMQEQQRVYEQARTKSGELSLEISREELRLERLVERKNSISVAPGSRCGNCGMTVTAEGPAYLKNKHEQERLLLDRQRQEILGRIAEMKSRVENKAVPVIGITAAQNQLYEAKSALNIGRANADRAATIGAEIEQVATECKAKIAEFRATVERRQHDLRLTEEKLAAFKTELAECELREKRVSVISDFYGPSGLRPMVIGRYGPYFASVANDYLSVFTGGSEKIVLSSKKKLASGEVRDKIEIMVSQGDDLRAFPSEFCAGETGAIDLSLNFAVMTLAAQKAGKTFGFMYFDEVTNGLSNLLVEQLFDLLKTRFYHKGITMILTTHRDVPEQHFDRVWTAIKEDGKCRVSE